MKKLLLAVLFAGSAAVLTPATQAGGYVQRDRYDDDDTRVYRHTYREERYVEPVYVCPPPVRYHRVVRYVPRPRPVVYRAPRRVLHRPHVGVSFAFRH